MKKEVNEKPKNLTEEELLKVSGGLEELPLRGLQLDFWCKQKTVSGKNPQVECGDDCYYDNETKKCKAKIEG